MINRRTRSFIIAGLAVLLIMVGVYLRQTDSQSATSQPDSYLIQTVSVDANYLKFENADALDTAADLVVIGEATQEFDKRKHVTTYFDDGATLQDFYTLTEITIDQVLKGPDDIRTDDLTLEIIEPLALIHNAGDTIKYTHGNYNELQKGEKSVIFLKKNTFGQYSVFNQNLGKFSLSTSETSTARIGNETAEYDTFKRDVLKKYGLNL